MYIYIYFFFFQHAILIYFPAASLVSYHPNFFHFSPFSLEKTKVQRVRNSPRHPYPSTNLTYLGLMVRRDGWILGNRGTGTFLGRGFSKVMILRIFFFPRRFFLQNFPPPTEKNWKWAFGRVDWMFYLFFVAFFASIGGFSYVSKGVRRLAVIGCVVDLQSHQLKVLRIRLGNYTTENRRPMEKEIPIENPSFQGFTLLFKGVGKFWS